MTSTDTDWTGYAAGLVAALTERFGLTITTDTQAVWLDDPHNVLRRFDQP